MYVCLHSLKASFVPLTAFVLVACGGDGGGGGAPPGPSPTPTPVRSWGTAAALEAEAGRAETPQIAVHGNGDAVAIWAQRAATGVPDIWVSRYDAATGAWSTPLIIDSESGGAGDPQIALDAAGNAMAVWEQSDGGRLDIWANRFDVATGTWSGAQLVETDDQGNALDPQVAMDPAGNAIAVWSQSLSLSSTYSVRAARHTAGSGWATPEGIDRAGGGTFDQRVAMDAAGNAIAVWVQANPTTGYNDLRANQYVYDAVSGTGAWGAAFDLGSSDGHAVDPEIAMNASGTAVVVWQQRDAAAGVYSVYANRLEAGVFGGRVSIGLDNLDAYLPHVAIDAAGNAIAVWQQYDGTHTAILASRYDDTAQTWDAPQSIVADSVNDAGEPRVALDARGNALAVWSQDNSSGTVDVWANRFAAGAWGAAERIETAAGHADDPRIAMDPNGNGIAVWEQGDLNTGVDDVIANDYR